MALTSSHQLLVTSGLHLLTHPKVDLWWWLTRPCPGRKLLFGQPFFMGCKRRAMDHVQRTTTIKTLALIRWQDKGRGQVLFPGVVLHSALTSQVSQKGMMSTWSQWWISEPIAFSHNISNIKAWHNSARSVLTHLATDTSQYSSIKFTRDSFKSRRYKSNITK